MSTLSRLATRALNKAGLGVHVHGYIDSEPCILLYHGVTDEPRRGVVNYNGKHVVTSRFEQQLAELARHRRMVPLAELVGRIREGLPCKRMVAVTFDDGYLNNLECAVPVLQRLGIPATFFLATGYIGTSRWMWQDRLESALHQCRLAEINSELLSALVPLGDDEAKTAFLRKVKSHLKTLHWQEAEERALQIAEQLGAPGGAPTGLYRFMSWNDVRALAGQGFEVGAHSVNHAILSRVPIEEARGEIMGSYQQVFDETGACSRVFCFPNGKTTDYTPQVVDFCREHFDAALSTQWGSAKPAMLHELARIIIDDDSTPAALAGWIAEAG